MGGDGGGAVDSMWGRKGMQDVYSVCVGLPEAGHRAASAV